MTDWIIDDRGFPKQGTHSVGNTKQHFLGIDLARVDKSCVSAIWGRRSPPELMRRRL